MSNSFTDTVLMIRPKHFSPNRQTAKTNAFQKWDGVMDDELKSKVEKEFDAMVDVLRANGITVEVFEDNDEVVTPDAIFPNNWFTTHADGSIVLYPMFAPNRREEVRQDIIESLKEKYGFGDTVDYLHYAGARIFLEGTGSMILDRDNKICYACLSPRTDERLLNEFCELKGYEPVVFDAFDKKGVDIYHTNVMMMQGPAYAVVCLEAIDDIDERRHVIKTLAANGKEIIPIAASQMSVFAGNMLHLQNDKGEDLLVMSERGRKVLIDSQVEKLSKHARILEIDVKTIEIVGGGSVRCMMAEIFKPV